MDHSRRRRAGARGRRDRGLAQALARRARRAFVTRGARRRRARGWGRRAGLLAELANRPLVALAFAKFADGRSFSYARLLRDRHGFRGELRAVGDVLIDEIPLMLRCGFDSFEVTDAPTLRALEAGRLPGPPIHYQPSSAEDETPDGGPPWRRVTPARRHPA